VPLPAGGDLWGEPVYVSEETGCVRLKQGTAWALEGAGFRCEHFDGHWGDHVPDYSAGVEA
jgi:hypothetical protein